MHVRFPLDPSSATAADRAAAALPCCPGRRSHARTVQVGAGPAAGEAAPLLQAAVQAAERRPTCQRRRRTRERPQNEVHRWLLPLRLTMRTAVVDADAVKGSLRESAGAGQPVRASGSRASHVPRACLRAAEPAAASLRVPLRCRQCRQLWQLWQGSHPVLRPSCGRAAAQQPLMEQATAFLGCLRGRPTQRMIISLPMYCRSTEVYPCMLRQTDQQLLC